MNIRKIITLIVLAIILTACSDSPDAQETESTPHSGLSSTKLLDNGASLESVISNCAACHSSDGLASNAQWPNLAAQNVDYLVLQLTSFRDGSRENRLMPASMLSDLSDQDLERVSLYYSNLPAASSTDALTVDLRELPGAHVRARCVSCHSMSGNAVTSLWPNLAGQNSGYLAKQLRDYKSGVRKHPLMEVIAGELNEQQMIDVAEYYKLAK